MIPQYKNIEQLAKTWEKFGLPASELTCDVVASLGVPPTVMSTKNVFVNTPTRSSKLASISSILGSEERVRVKADTEYWLGKLVTQCPKMLALKDLVRKVAPTKHTVLICGETGTGKELVAKALHADRIGQFIPVNCAGFPEHLIESELFGHIKGSFTGADRDKQGLFEAAENGTLFIDEIAELPLLMQSKLLRVLQERTVRPVGDTRERRVNCRVVAATHQSLPDLVLAGKFREDLLWRINTIVLKTVPIRERLDDIPMITKALGYLLNVNELNNYNGNVRQLEQDVIRAQLGLDVAQD